jgi:hypothetical protein
MPAASTSDSAASPPPPPPAGAAPAAAVSSLRPTLGDNVSAPRGHPCKTCGSPVEPGDQFCHACGAAQPVDPARGAAKETAPQKQFRCQHCGAEMSVDANQFSFACPFCDSTYVLELPTGAGQRERPGFVIGFSIPPDKALVKFREWLAGGSVFHPGDLRSAQAEGKLRGVYLPFWSFSMLADSQWSAQIGEHWYRTETYTVTVDGKTETRTREVQETEWWPLDGKHHNYYSGYLVSGSKGLPQAQAERIKPYYLGALKRYAPFFLAGWFSEEYSVAKDAAQAACQQEFLRWEQQNIAKFLPGDTNRGLALQTEFSQVNSDLILLPVYLLSYRYGGKLYRFLLNGQTGKTAGDKPLSPWRIAIAIAAGGLILAMLWLLLRRL